MTTYDHDAVIVTLANRASTQVREGLAALQAGQLLEAEVHFRAAHATLSSLALLLETPPQKPPIRKLCIVGTAAAPHDPELAPWMETTHGDDDGDAA